MKMRSVLPLWILVAVSLFLAVGCEIEDDEDGSDTVGADTSNTGVAAATVTFLNENASPSAVTLRAGGKVTFQNNDGDATHFLSFTPDGTIPDTGDIAPGASATATFSAPGNYGFGCDYHTNSVDERGAITVR